jgi:hypothetical protein
VSRWNVTSESVRTRGDLRAPEGGAHARAVTGRAARSDGRRVDDRTVDLMASYRADHVRPSGGARRPAGRSLPPGRSAPAGRGPPVSPDRAPSAASGAITSAMGRTGCRRPRVSARHAHARRSMPTGPTSCGPPDRRHAGAGRARPRRRGGREPGSGPTTSSVAVAHAPDDCDAPTRLVAADRIVDPPEPQACEEVGMVAGPDLASDALDDPSSPTGLAHDDAPGPGRPDG